MSMKSIKEYINESLLDDEEDLIDNNYAAIKAFIDENYDINGSYTIKGNIVDVNGGIGVKRSSQPKLKALTNGLFKFGTVRNNFVCRNCRSLLTLEGAPKKIGGSLNCMMCPNLISFDCDIEWIDYNVYCSNCVKLESLKGLPKIIGMHLDCSGCDSLISLEGSPEYVRGDFECHNCMALLSLKGAPKKVGGMFDCHDCISLKTLEGAPKEVGGNLECFGCYRLESIKDAPKKIGGYFIKPQHIRE